MALVSADRTLLVVIFVLLCGRGADIALADDDAATASVYQDADGNVHIDPASINGSVFVGQTNVVHLAEQLASLQSNFNLLWRFHRLNPAAPSIVAIGGFNGQALNTVEVFDGSSWQPAPPMPTNRFAMSAAVFRNRLYVVGGEHDVPLATVEVFDGTGWTAAPSMPTARLWPAVAAFQNKLFAVAGFNDSYLATVEVFGGAQWSSAPSLRVARRGAAAVVYNERLFVVGGKLDERFLSAVEVFDGSAWSLLSTPMPTPRSTPGAGVYKGRLFVVGGWNSIDGDTPAVEAFDGATWQSMAPLPTARRVLAVTAYKGKLFAIGGHSQASGSSVRVVEAYDGQSWSSDYKDMPTARSNVAAAVFPGE